MSKENKAAAPRSREGQGRRSPKKEDKTVWKVPVGDSRCTGPDTALVTIVEFSDFQCPFCKRVGDTMKKVNETYGDKVRIVWKHEPLPFHPRAEPAAEAGRRCAFKEKGDKGFWAAHDKLFDLQPKLEDADLERRRQGARPRRREGQEGDQARTSTRRSIDADAELGRRRQGQRHAALLHQRPAPRRRAAVREVPEDHRRRAEERASDSSPRAIAPKDVYDEIMKDGKGPPAPGEEDVPAPTSANPFKGGANAKVVIQEFSDFQCPFCRRVEPRSSRSSKTYGDKVKSSGATSRSRCTPTRRSPPRRARGLQAEGPDGFWKMHDKLFENQSTPDGIKRPALEKYAEGARPRHGQVQGGARQQHPQGAIDADRRSATTPASAARPAFVINGYFVSGAQPFPKFKKLIDRALAEAK